MTTPETFGNLSSLTDLFDRPSNTKNIPRTSTIIMVNDFLYQIANKAVYIPYAEIPLETKTLELLQFLIIHVLDT